MAYSEKNLAGYVLLIDAQGTAQDDVAAPPEGQTLIYTTEQGLVLERAPSEVFEARQWFLDQPVLLNGPAEYVELIDTARSILEAPYEIPDDIDAESPTFYRLEAQVSVTDFFPDTSSIGIWVVPYVDGDPVSNAVIVPCDAAANSGGATVTFFVTGAAGNSIDLQAYLINASDAAKANVAVGLLKRELRVPVVP